jgi:hypothetical protein
MKTWPDVHSVEISNFINKWGDHYIYPDKWEELMSEFNAMSLDNRLELVLWFISQTPREGRTLKW